MLIFGAVKRELLLCVASLRLSETILSSSSSRRVIISIITLAGIIMVRSMSLMVVARCKMIDGYVRSDADDDDAAMRYSHLRYLPSSISRLSLDRMRTVLFPAADAGRSMGGRRRS